MSVDFAKVLPSKEYAMEAPNTGPIVKRKVAKASFLWIIEHFSNCWKRHRHEVVSSKFHTFGSWYLVLQTNDGNDHTCCDCHSLSLKLHYEYSRKNWAEVTLCVVGVANNEALKISSEVVTLTGGSPRRSVFLGAIKKSALERQAAEILPGDTLTIRCDVTFVDYASNVHTIRQSNSVSATQQCLSEDLDWLVDGGNCADVTVYANGGTMRAHKAILASRSPVFRAMFEHDMLEKQQGEVFVPDIEHEVFGEMLRFIYTERSPNIDGMADALMVAADKYALQRLRDMCEGVLCRNLSFESAASSLIVADKLDATVLRESSLNFICANLCDVVKTDGWNTLVTNNINLLLEVIVAARLEWCKVSVKPAAKKRKHS